MNDAATFSNSTVSPGALSIAQNWLDLEAERGPSSFDQRHLLSVQAQYTTGVGVTGGTLPTGKIGVQGRSVLWNALIHDHVTTHWWLELENNATYFVDGPRDGKMQNFITPATYYVIKKSEWKPTHPYFVLAEGVQIATSGFHTYNHNLISELRILF